MTGEHINVADASMVLNAAHIYCRHRWSVIPVPFKSKNPGINGWPHLRLSESDIPKYFRNGLQNIGVLLGEPSGWLVDIDLDHPLAVELADKYLPPTDAVFGHPSKPRSHRLYIATKPVKTKTHKSKSAGMLVEFRSTGLQTVFPPSTHHSGELITWSSESIEPVRINPEELTGCVERLANAVRTELGLDGELQSQLSSTPNNQHSKTNSSITECVNAMLRMKMTDQNDGSARLFAAACRTVEYDLTDADAIAAIRKYNSNKPFPYAWSDDEILTRIHDAEHKTQRGVAIQRQSRSYPPTIIINTDEHRVVSETISALRMDDDLFQRSGYLVRILNTNEHRDSIIRSENASTISLLPPASLREHMTKYAAFVKLCQKNDGIKTTPIHPPSWLVNEIHARGDWFGMRSLTAISEVPILRPDGTIFQTPGYDKTTGVLFIPNTKFPAINSDVTIDNAKVALDAILSIVSDFRFERAEHQAAWLAALLTPFARFAFHGPAPLFLIDANVRGAGKGLLVQIIGQIVLGSEMPASGYSHKTEEMRKIITTLAVAGDRLVHLDNIVGNFGNAALDRALTTTRWKDRILGKNEQTDLSLNCTWYATGNNVTIGADTIRRIIHIRLDVLEEHPEERADFTHPNLIAWVRKQRPELVAHILTILSAYFNAGRPTHNFSPFGSFEEWSRLVREAIVWVGLPDPCLTRTRLAESADTATDSLMQLIHAWREYDAAEVGIVLSELLSNLYRNDSAPNDEVAKAMRSAIENLVGCPPGKKPTARQLGNKIRHFRRRVIDQYYLDRDPNEYNRKGTVWRLHRTDR